MGADKIAVVFRNLMRRLGFKKYYIQGGDWGSIITKNMATFFPEVIMYQKNPKQKSAISISSLKFQLDKQIGPEFLIHRCRLRKVKYMKTITEPKLV